jgi:hypothetical protein
MGFTSLNKTGFVPRSMDLEPFQTLAPVYKYSKYTRDEKMQSWDWHPPSTIRNILIAKIKFSIGMYADFPHNSLDIVSFRYQFDDVIFLY